MKGGVKQSGKRIGSVLTIYVFTLPVLYTQGCGVEGESRLS